MKIYDEIIGLIEAEKLLCVPVQENSDFYIDLDFDSLEFIRLLLHIEEIYSVRFDIREMDECLLVGRLAAMVERKTEEASHGQKLISRSEE